jgi:glutamate-1-semialdehyde 2,1-aminomutase
MVNTGQKFLNKAKKIIPGGNQLLSKRSEIFLPDQWPNYYKKAKGCEVWDLDGKKYYDFAGMGVTSCTLGYANKDVNNVIKKALDKSNMCTLNADDEFYLAKKLLKIHTWAEMAKFCKSGGEACMVAIRLARAVSKKQKIAFCGYHGWHDWYLAANLQNSKNLDKQLLKGLSPKGVSQSFKNSIFPFNYNNIESLEKILKDQKNKIGIIIMEPMRAIKPKNNFLKKVRRIADKNEIILIFDEITSGFHDFYGGIHLKFKVNPDIAIFGKSLGNGYPISAIIGKRKYIDVSQDTFISSTMWTDKIGFVAANKTLEILEKKKINKKIVEYGKYIKKNWQLIAKKYSITIEIFGQDSMPGFKFEDKRNLEISTYFIQEMLYRGFLANTTISISSSYNQKIIDKYLKNFDKVFKKIQNSFKKKNF